MLAGQLDAYLGGCPRSDSFSVQMEGTDHEEVDGCEMLAGNRSCRCNQYQRCDARVRAVRRTVWRTGSVGIWVAGLPAMWWLVWSHALHSGTGNRSRGRRVHGSRVELSGLC